MKKKVLFVMSSLRNGGAERSLINLLQLFDYNLYDVDLLLFQQEGMFLNQLPKEVNLISENIKLHILYKTKSGGIIEWKHLLLSMLHVYATVCSKMKEKNELRSRQYRWNHYYNKSIEVLNTSYDVAIAYIQGEATYYLVDKVIADKKIAWVHTDYSKIEPYKDMDYRYFEKVDKVVSISDACLDSLKKEFPALADKVCMLPNLTSSVVVRNLANAFYPPEFNKKITQFVSVGRLHKVKGFDLAIKAAAILKQHGLRFKWYILGNGELKDELEKMIQKEEVSDCFELIGAKENPYPYMKNADVVVQTSRFEGKSVVLDEAKILGCPIVVTNYPTVHDQISSDEGIITELTPEGIASGVEEVLDKKTKFSEFLLANEYGNQHEIQGYYKLIEE